jgi:hypothetical protein
VPSTAARPGSPTQLLQSGERLVHGRSGSRRRPPAARSTAAARSASMRRSRPRGDRAAERPSPWAFTPAPAENASGLRRAELVAREQPVEEREGPADAGPHCVDEVRAVLLLRSRDAPRPGSHPPDGRVEELPSSRRKPWPRAGPRTISVSKTSARRSCRAERLLETQRREPSVARPALPATSSAQDAHASAPECLVLASGSFAVRRRRCPPTPSSRSRAGKRCLEFPSSSARARLASSAARSARLTSRGLARPRPRRRRGPPGGHEGARGLAGELQKGGLPRLVTPPRSESSLGGELSAANR